MTFEIGLVLSLVAATVVLFVLEKPRADVVALLLMGALAVTGLLEPKEALSGFSSPAVITVWAVFILSAGLSKTGVAQIMGQVLLRLAGTGEVRLMVLIMLVSGTLSAFMNNVGATALLLPVVMNLARRTGTAPSKLLIPLSFSSLLGGMTTLIGTPPNILISEAVRDRGVGELGLFSFTPVGASVMIAGILYMALIGRHLLPARDLTQESAGDDLRTLFGLHKRILILKLPEGSPLVGKTLAESRIQAALDLIVLGIVRGARTRLAPGPDDLLEGGDRLLVEGRPRRLEELRGAPNLTLGESEIALERVISGQVEIAAVRLAASSNLVGRTVIDSDFRNRFGPVVIALRRGGELVHTGLDATPLAAGDVLLLQTRKTEAQALTESADFEALTGEEAGISELHDLLMRLRIPEGSALAGRTVADSGLSAFGLMLLALSRGGETRAMPAPSEVLAEGDTLLVKGEHGDLEIISGLQSLEVERRGEQSAELIESSRVGLAVVAIAPNARIARRTLRQLHFRERYGLSVLAVWRQGRVLRSGLPGQQLKFGDALLVHGPRDKLHLLASEPDFLVLTEDIQEAPKYDKAPIALLMMAGVLAATLSGWLPIYISAVIGAALMVVSGCLTIDEAYHEIEWRAVFLIGGMLPLGLAMEKSGAAAYLATQVVEAIGGIGPAALLGGLFLVAVAAAQVMPTSAVALLLAPIAIDTANQVGISPLSLVMAIAVGATTAFISPVTHPANVLVMGPGGYRFFDYAKVGVPLVAVTFLVVMVVVPWVWPFVP